MNPSRFRRSEGAAGGFILIAVLWILAALATLASIYSIYAIRTAASSHMPDQRLQAEASIRAGVELAAFQLTAGPEKTRRTQGYFEVRVGKTKVAVRYRSERARIDLNAAPKPLLAGLFASVGVRDAAAADYADRIVGWRTKVDPKVQNAEASIYKAAGLAYPPRQAPFNDPLELSLVAGLPPAVVERILPDVTVFSGGALVDVVSAEPEVLAALPGMTPDILQKVLAARAADAEDRKGAIALLGPAAANSAADAGKAFRAEIEVDLAGFRRVHAQVVFKLDDNGDDPYQIWYWRDDFDGPFLTG